MASPSCISVASGSKSIRITSPSAGMRSTAKCCSSAKRFNFVSTLLCLVYVSLSGYNQLDILICKHVYMYISSFACRGLITHPGILFGHTFIALKYSTEYITCALQGTAGKGIG